MDLKPLIALLAIVNPIGAIPFFISFTTGFSRQQRQRTIRVSAFSAFLVISISAVAGLRIIEFFGISIASFQVGGGTLLLISSLQMLNARQAETSAEDVTEGASKADAGDSIAVVPLTIPLLTGPATISTMVIYAERTRHWWQLGTLVAYGVVIGVAVFLAFSASGLNRRHPLGARPSFRLTSSISRFFCARSGPSFPLRIRSRQPSASLIWERSTSARP